MKTTAKILFKYEVNIKWHLWNYEEGLWLGWDKWRSKVTGFWRRNSRI